jgi:hypothetical protein
VAPLRRRRSLSAEEFVYLRARTVGLQRSVREWAIRQGWNGRPID